MDKLSESELLKYRRRKIRLGLYIRQCIKHIVPLDYYKIKLNDAIRIFAKEICGDETNSPNVWFENKIAEGFFDSAKYTFRRNRVKGGIKPVSYKKFLMSPYWIKAKSAELAFKLADAEKAK